MSPDIQFVGRLMEIMQSGENETARKACAELLKGGRVDVAAETVKELEETRAQLHELRHKVPPWKLMSKLDPADTAEAYRLYHQGVPPGEEPPPPHTLYEYDEPDETPDPGSESDK